MFGSLLITLREGLEAALILGIILAFLNSTNNRKWFKYVWIGTGVALFTSVVAGGVLFGVVGAFEGRAEMLFEGFGMLLATGILTWMIFWMRSQARNIKAHLHDDIQTAISNGSSLALAGLAFVAVVREGVETALFLFAATRGEESPLLATVGGLIGLIAAIGIGYAVYKGTTKLSLKAFFNVTGILLILFAGGLFAHGIHELQEAGLVPIIIEHVWDVNNILPESSTLGRFFSAIFGYNGNPSLIEVIFYAGYLVSMPFLFFKSGNRQLTTAEV